MTKIQDMLNRLEAIDENSLEATHIRDQLREASQRAFMKTIAPSFQRPDGSYPDWITRNTTKLGPPYEENR